MEKVKLVKSRQHVNECITKTVFQNYPCAPLKKNLFQLLALQARNQLEPICAHIVKSLTKAAGNRWKLPHRKWFAVQDQSASYYIISPFPCLNWGKSVLFWFMAFRDKTTYLRRNIWIRAIWRLFLDSRPSSS